MAQTLEEFLINVKYNIDVPSQQTFFNAMKRAATSVAGVAGEMTALGIAIMKLSDRMATAGEKLYWMSQRVGDSVTNIQGLSFALSNLGISGDEATAGIERFGAWTRSMGPAATSYLRSLGVTATDTVGRMRQLGDYFRTHGGTAAQQGSLEYALTLRRWQQMGGDERSMLALSSGQLEEKERQGGIMQRLVWGKDWQTGPQKFADQSVQVMNQFRKMGFFFTNLNEQLSLNLFNVILPELEKINQLFEHILPYIQTFINHLISYAPAAMHFLEGVMKAFEIVLRLGTVAMETFDKLPQSMQIFAAALLALPGALRLVGSPLFWILGGIFMLLGALDDYQHWLDDQKHPGQSTSAFDWGKITAPFEPLIDMFKGVNKFIEDLTGIHDGLLKIAELAVGLWAVSRAIRAIGRGLRLAAGATAATGLASRLASLMRFGVPIAAAIAIAGGIHEAESPENVARAKKMFGDDSAASLAKALAAKAMGDAAGLSPEEWVKRNFPQWLDPKATEDKPKVDPTIKDPTNVDIGLGIQNFLRSLFGLPPNDPLRRGEPTNLGIGDFFRKLFRFPTDTDGSGGGGGRRGIGGGYQLASFGGFAGATGDEFFSPERFYILFLFSFQTITDRLTDILTTLLAMATHQGVDPAGLPRGGRGGSTGQMAGDPTSADQLLKDVMEIWGVTQDEAAPIVSAILRESGGKANITEGGGAYQRYIPGTNIGVGYFQHTGSRHKELEEWAAARGLDPADGRTQLMFGKWEADHKKAYANWRETLHSSDPEAFGNLFESGGHFTGYTHGNYNDWLRHRPLGVDGSPGSPASNPPVKSYPDISGGVHSQATIHVHAPNPASAAAQTVEAQNRVFEQHIRYAKGAFLA